MEDKFHEAVRSLSCDYRFPPLLRSLLCITTHININEPMCSAGPGLKACSALDLIWIDCCWLCRRWTLENSKFCRSEVWRWKLPPPWSCNIVESIDPPESLADVDVDVVVRLGRVLVLTSRRPSRRVCCGGVCPSVTRTPPRWSSQTDLDFMTSGKVVRLMQHERHAGGPPDKYRRHSQFITVYAVQVPSSQLGQLLCNQLRFLTHLITI